MWFLAAFCYWYYRRVQHLMVKRSGVGILYAIARFVIEMFRADQRGSISVIYQRIGVLLTVTGLVMLIAASRGSTKPEARVPGGGQRQRHNKVKR